MRYLSLSHYFHGPVYSKQYWLYLRQNGAEKLLNQFSWPTSRLLCYLFLCTWTHLDTHYASRLWKRLTRLGSVQNQKIWQNLWVISSYKMYTSFFCFNALCGSSEFWVGTFQKGFRGFQVYGSLWQVKPPQLQTLLETLRALVPSCSRQGFMMVTCYVPEEDHNSLTHTACSTPPDLEFEFCRQVLYNLRHPWIRCIWLIFRGYHDSWKAIFLKDCVKFLWSLNLICFIASLCPTSRLQKAMSVDRSCCLFAWGQEGQSVLQQVAKLWRIYQSCRRQIKDIEEKACLLPRQLDLSVWTVPDNWQCAIHVSPPLGGSTLRGTSCTPLWPKQPSANQQVHGCRPNGAQPSSYRWADLHLISCKKLREIRSAACFTTSHLMLKVSLRLSCCRTRKFLSLDFQSTAWGKKDEPPVILLRTTRQQAFGLD